MSKPMFNKRCWFRKKTGILWRRFWRSHTLIILLSFLHMLSPPVVKIGVPSIQVQPLKSVLIRSISSQVHGSFPLTLGETSRSTKLSKYVQKNSASEMDGLVFNIISIYVPLQHRSQTLPNSWKTPNSTKLLNWFPKSCHVPLNHTFYCWLVVSPPLKNMSQLGFSEIPKIYGKSFHPAMFQSLPTSIKGCSYGCSIQKPSEIAGSADHLGVSENVVYPIVPSLVLLIIIPMKNG